MATDLFLIRKNQTFAKYTQVEGISLTATTTQVISGVTGTESTNIITLPVGMTAPVLGSIVYFSALTGGSGLSTNRMYYVIEPSSNTFQVADTPSGSAINFTSNVTAARKPSSAARERPSSEVPRTTSSTPPSNGPWRRQRCRLAASEAKGSHDDDGFAVGVASW